MIQKLKNYLWHWPKAVVASVWYGWPARRLTMIGVTGTKGKTTTAHMIYHILRADPRYHFLDTLGSGSSLTSSSPPGLPKSKVLSGSSSIVSKMTSSGQPSLNYLSVGLISTIGAFFGDEEIDTGLHVTSPDPRELQRLLKMAVDKGLTHVVLEVTSSGLDQFRVWGIKFKAAVITNIYPDHLDYHGTMEKYVEAKGKMIRQSEVVVLSEDSPYFSELNRRAEEAGTKVVTIPSGLPRRPDRGVGTPRNDVMAVAAVEALEIKSLKELKKLKLLKILESFPGVPGRMETVYDKKFKVVIDFAHTPESLAAALGDLRKLVKKNGRLIAVFGCAGERDHGRRRMGEVAAKMADLFVITAEDPRTEKVEEISEEIAGWAKAAGAAEVFDKARPFFIRIPDRQEAINYAISMAKQGDVVGCFGKGHEKSMAFGKKELPWSEYEAVKGALKSKKRGEGLEGIEGREGERQCAAAVILAAGEGTRIKARRKNKVAYKLAGKPMIRYVVETLERVGVGQIIVVVKYFENSVRDALRGNRVIFARQGDKKGTAAALEDGLKEMVRREGREGEGTEGREGLEGGRQYPRQILVMYGDDSAFYPVELFKFILTEHRKHESDVTLLSIKVDNPKGLGRILRDDNGEAVGIVEEKVATDEQKEIKEINTGCYCFRRDFIEKRIGEIEINPISQEYYLTDIVEVALRHKDRVHVCLYPDNLIWHGINDRSQWAKAIRKKKYDMNG